MKLHRKKTQQLRPVREPADQTPAEEALPADSVPAVSAEASSGEVVPNAEGGEAPEESPGAEESSEEAELGPGEASERAETVSEESAAIPEEEAPEGRPGPMLKPRRRRKHRKKNWFLRILITAAVIAAVIVVGNLPAFGITQIAVIGNRTVSDKRILELSELQKGDSIVFINPWLTGSRVRRSHYIDSVRIVRHLPGTVEIIVKEREAAAQLVMQTEKKKKRYVCITEDGMVIGKSEEQKPVTMVINVAVVKAETGEKIKVDDKGVYSRSMDLIRTAKEGDLYFKRIFIKGSLVHAYIYDDLMCTGRYDNIISSIRTGTLKSVVYKLYQEDVRKGIINIGDNNYCSFTP